MKKIPSIKLPIIKNGNSSNLILSDITENKKIVIFGVPGAFTPTCSEKHLPGYINLYDQFRKKGVHEIYCLSVNDAFVMKTWLESYSKGKAAKSERIENSSLRDSNSLDKSSILLDESTVESS